MGTLWVMKAGQENYYWQTARKNNMSCPEIVNTAGPDEYRAGSVIYRTANREDNEILNSILRQTPMTSWVTLSTQYEPCYFTSADIFGHRETIVAYKNDDSGTTVGMGSYVSIPVHINGNKVTAGYLAELRVLPAFRNKPGIIRNAFKSMENFAGTLTKDAHWFTSIATQNTVARRLLEANLKGMPEYRPQGELVSMALSAKAGKYLNIMQPARVVDIPALVEFYNRQVRLFQYSPVLSEQWLSKLDGGNGLQLQDFWLLKKDESIRACFAVWDQRNFKQTVVRGYRFPINIIRRLYNLRASLSRQVKLPKTLSPLRQSGRLLRTHHRVRNGTWKSLTLRREMLLPTSFARPLAVTPPTSVTEAGRLLRLIRLCSMAQRLTLYGVSREISNSIRTQRQS